MFDGINGNNFAMKMVVAGFDLPEGTCRIVIDIPLADPVKIYYETIASGKTLDVVIEELMQNKDNIQVKEIS